MKLKRHTAKVNKVGRKINFKNFLWVILATSVVLQIFLAIQSIGTGSKVTGLEEKQNEILSENRRLQRELVSKTSLTSLNKRAEELGFNNKELPFYLKAEDSFAQAIR